MVDSESALRATGLRVTRQRVAVFNAVKQQPHVSAVSVLADVATVLPGISHQAVYDCLAHLAEAGLLRRFVVDGGPMLYETRTNDNHHHFVCRSCNAVIDIDCALGAAPCIDVQLPYGFSIDEAEVTYRGLCATCHGAVTPTIPTPS
jgi:Fur family ferric uptake transcriptional regulator